MAAPAKPSASFFDHFDSLEDRASSVAGFIPCVTSSSSPSAP